DRDAPWVQRVSEYLGTHLHTVTLDTPDLIENLLVPLYAHDLPAMGQMETSLYLLFKAMKKEATVALSGESAYEVFGGYPWFHHKEVLAAETFPWNVIMTGEESERRANHYIWLSEEVREKIQPEAYNARRYQEAIAEVPRLAGE